MGGRAGKSGYSITLMEWRDRRNAKELISILEEAKQEVPDQLLNMARKFAAQREREGDDRRGYGRQNEGCFKCHEKGHFSKDCPLNRQMDGESPTWNRGRW